MYTGALQAFGLMIGRTLGIAPGVTLRKTYTGINGQSSTVNQTGCIADAIETHDFINSMVDITADDVCIGSSPVYVSGLDTIKSVVLRQRVSDLCDALNGIAKWTAIDLLKTGLSMYVLHTYDDVVARRKKAKLVPFIEDVGIYMRRDGTIIIYDSNGHVLENVLVFLNYSKSSLEIITSDMSSEDVDGIDWSEIQYRVIPEPIQLKNISSVAQDLYAVERSMYSYRQKLARVVRFATVDVGTSQGDRTQEIIDDISQTLNADSLSLQTTMTPNASFDDGIPVHPHRKGVGKPEIVTDIPSFDIKEMADLDYTLGRVFLAMRFPKTYADFNQQLDSNTVSLIRGDIRYSRMVASCRSLMEDTINHWFRSTADVLEQSDVFFRLVKLPTSEDSDVVDTLTNFADFSNAFFDTLNASETREEALARISSLESLLDDTSNLHSIQSWLEEIRKYVNDKFDAIDREQAAADELMESESSASGGVPTPPGFDAAEAAASAGMDAEEIAAGAALAAGAADAGAPSAVPE